MNIVLTLYNMGLQIFYGFSAFIHIFTIPLGTLVEDSFLVSSSGVLQKLYDLIMNNSSLYELTLFDFITTAGLSFFVTFVLIKWLLDIVL